MKEFLIQVVIGSAIIFLNSFGMGVDQDSGNYLTSEGMTINQIVEQLSKFDVRSEFPSLISQLSEDDLSLVSRSFYQKHSKILVNVDEHASQHYSLAQLVLIVRLLQQYRFSRSLSDIRSFHVRGKLERYASECEVNISAQIMSESWQEVFNTLPEGIQKNLEKEFKHKQLFKKLKNSPIPIK